MEKKNEKNNFLKTNKLKNQTKPKKKPHLSFKSIIPFEKHPSVSNLILEDTQEKEKINNNFIVEINNNNNNNNINNDCTDNKNSHERSKSTFEFRVNKIEEKLYQNEVFYTKNENPKKNNSKKLTVNYCNAKLNRFSEKDKFIDKEITKDIQNGEDSENIINKISNFVILKKSK